MKKSYSRRQMLRTLSAASAGLLVAPNVVQRDRRQGN